MLEQRSSGEPRKQTERDKGFLKAMTLSAQLPCPVQLECPSEPVTSQECHQVGTKASAYDPWGIFYKQAIQRFFASTKGSCTSLGSWEWVIGKPDVVCEEKVVT